MTAKMTAAFVDGRKEIEEKVIAKDFNDPEISLENILKIKNQLNLK